MPPEESKDGLQMGRSKKDPKKKTMIQRRVSCTRCFFFFFKFETETYLSPLSLFLSAPVRFSGEIQVMVWDHCCYLAASAPFERVFPPNYVSERR